MADAKDKGGADPKEQTGEGAPATKPATPHADQVNSQDKTKDKPDSGQNEDG